MTSRTRTGRTIASLLAVLPIIVGIGGFDHPDHAAAQNARRVVMTTKFSFRGVVTASGSFDENKCHPLAISCADWAKGLPDRLALMTFLKVPRPAWHRKTLAVTR